MVICTPDERTRTRQVRGFSGLFGPVAPAEYVVVADRVVAPIQSAATPPYLEHALGHASLIARMVVDRAPAGRWPSGDLNRETLRFIHQCSVTAQSFLARGNEGRDVYLARRRLGAVGEHVATLA